MGLSNRVSQVPVHQDAIGLREVGIGRPGILERGDGHHFEVKIRKPFHDPLDRAAVGGIGREGIIDDDHRQSLFGVHSLLLRGRPDGERVEFFSGSSGLNTCHIVSPADCLVLLGIPGGWNIVELSGKA